MKYRNFGRKSLKEIKEAMDKYPSPQPLFLGMNLEKDEKDRWVVIIEEEEEAGVEEEA